MDDRAERVERFRQHFTSMMLAKKPDTFTESVEALEALPRSDPPAMESLRKPLTAQPAGPAPNIVAGLPQEGPLPGRDLPARVRPPSIRFTVSEDEHAALRVIAQAEGKSIASFAREAVRAYIHSR
ncbi:MAG TPA: hypothetical protein VIT46_05945 [Gaiellaceae bacterium]